MSADPLAHCWAEPFSSTAASTRQRSCSTTRTTPISGSIRRPSATSTRWSATSSRRSPTRDAFTGLTQVRNDYGFTGTGQTVAVIDSGIAWDHSRSAAAWGRTIASSAAGTSPENDANPYDDGPAGSHGTHVAGIVGATAAGTADDGVAPGVDLVGLRVFNDAGHGYFSWVENALRGSTRIATRSRTRSPRSTCRSARRGTRRRFPIGRRSKMSSPN